MSPQEHELLPADLPEQQLFAALCTHLLSPKGPIESCHPALHRLVRAGICLTSLGSSFHISYLQALAGMKAGVARMAHLS